MMQLTAENVEKVFDDCLFNDGEPRELRVEVEGIVARFGYHPVRLEGHKKEIHDMLKQLPDTFQKKEGGGMSFLNACNDKDGNQWTGLHQTMEQLLTLGIATGKAKYCLPKDMWNVFPGGIPYFYVTGESK